MEFKTLHFNWHWQLQADPESLWPLISDTNRLYRELNLPSVQKTDISFNYKRGHTQLSYNSLKKSDAWEEEPFEWERPYRFGVRRYYKSGPFKTLKIQADLLPNENGTRIRYQLWIEPRNFISALTTPLKLKTIFRSNLKAVLKKYDHWVNNDIHPYETAFNKRLSRGNGYRIEKIRKEVNAAVDESHIFSKLIEFIRRADDNDLEQIKPYELADYWNVSREKTLKVFLHSAKQGLLNFNWNLYCPDCRTVQHTCRTLNEIHEPIFCSDCNKEFHINFNRSVQLSFRPNPLIRKLSEERYCITGPQTTSHIAVQQFVKSGDTRYLKINLEEGRYHLRIQGIKGKLNCLITESGSDNVTMTFNEYGFDNQTIELSPDPNLIFKNETGRDHIFILEKAEWNTEGVTAARITSKQIFRDLFDKEVLRKGEKISVDEQTLMFTDLLDSTGMYNKEGDDAAVKRVIEHFDVLQNAVADEGGAIVKTIGDSVMAVFSNPAQAVNAFLKAQNIISRDRRFNKSLKLKAGIHHGSCVAVNLNNKIDYFGSTVNIASRLVELANEDELVISNSVSQHSKASNLIEDENNKTLYTRNASTQLRGFENEEFTITHISLDKPSLRLVI